VRLSRGSEYGLEGLVFLARQPRGTIKLINEIAEAQGLPRSFLAKIFQKFVQHGIVSSFRGRERGYALARPPGDIALKDILEAIDGPDLFDRCLWNDRCREAEPCRLHDRWTHTRRGVVRMVSQTTLGDLIS
jgi:Rrf2 family protein